MHMAYRRLIVFVRTRPYVRLSRVISGNFARHFNTYTHRSVSVLFSSRFFFLRDTVLHITALKFEFFFINSFLEKFHRINRFDRTEQSVNKYEISIINYEI